jgi:hypothetical protein
VPYESSFARSQWLVSYPNAFVEWLFLFIVFLTGIRIQIDVVEVQLGLDLCNIRSSQRSPSKDCSYSVLTLCLKASRSSKVRESDFAITGTTLTTSESFWRTTMSIGFRLDPSRSARGRRWSNWVTTDILTSDLKEWQRRDSNVFWYLGCNVPVEQWVLYEGRPSADPWYIWWWAPN